MKRSWRDKTLISELRCTLAAEPEQVWQALASSADARQAEAIGKIEQGDYDEYRPSGQESVFAILERIPGERYSFSMKNSFLIGEYDCRLVPLPQGGTQLYFQDKITFYSRLAWLISSYGMPLKRSQKIRVKALRQRLGQEKVN